MLPDTVLTVWKRNRVIVNRDDVENFVNNVSHRVNIAFISLRLLTDRFNARIPRKLLFLHLSRRFLSLIARPRDLDINDDVVEHCLFNVKMRAILEHGSLMSRETIIQLPPKWLNAIAPAFDPNPFTLPNYIPKDKSQIFNTKAYEAYDATRKADDFRRKIHNMNKNVSRI